MARPPESMDTLDCGPGGRERQVSPPSRQVSPPSETDLQEQISQLFQALLVTKNDLRDMRLSVRQLEKESENTQTTRTQTSELVAALDEMITKNASLRDQINDFSDALTVTKRDLHDI